MSTYVVNPVEVRMSESAKGSIYESIVVMGMRSRQINDQIKNQITARMADVITDTDETEGTNYDQLNISREFDILPKPTFLAMKEMVTGHIEYHMPEQPPQVVEVVEAAPVSDDVE
jgi:DNA-directed RNA polymerase subunit K/omega